MTTQPGDVPTQPNTSGGWSAVPRRLWGRYWRYVAFSFGLFVLGSVAGALFVDQLSLGALLGAGTGPGALDEALPEPTVGLLVVNNTIVLVTLVASGATLGLLTAGILVFNGFLVGYVVVLVAREAGPVAPVVGILPHGILEIPAILFASAVAFRFSHQVINAARGRREDVMTSQELRDAILVVVVALVLIPIAAVIEARVTTQLLEQYVGV